MNSDRKIVRILIFIFCIPTTAFIFFTAVLSLFRTTYFELYQAVKVPYYKNGHPLIVIFLTIMFFSLIILFNKKEWKFWGKLLQRKGWYLIAGGSISLFFVLAFRGTATADSMALSEIAVMFLEGNGSAFEDYLKIYPHQLGAVAQIQLVYFLFGAFNYPAYQLINVAAIISILYLLNRITEELFTGEAVLGYARIVSAGMLPLFLYATFMYGDIPGLAFTVAAIYYEILFIKNNGFWRLAMAILMISTAILLKSNYWVILVAMVIILILKWITQMPKRQVSGHIQMGVGILGLILLPQIFQFLLNQAYRLAFGIDVMPQGAPKLLWIAMGLQEDAPFEYGWYNGFNRNTYVESGFDVEKSNLIAWESIKASLHNFVSRPKFALKFFYHKYISQWNAPCFESLITNEWTSRHSENLSVIANFLLYGIGRKILLQLMNLYHFLFYFCITVFGIKNRKRINLEQSFLLLCFLGGILFHLLWEAQGRYALPYFVLMLPLAAKGLEETVSCSLTGMKGKQNE